MSKITRETQPKRSPKAPDPVALPEGNDEAVSSEGDQADQTSPRASRAHQLMETFWGFGQLMRQHIIPSVVGEHGLDFKDFITLISIKEGAHYPKFICERLLTSPSDVSRTLEMLSKRGLIRRELDDHDSRRVRVTLTAQGTDILRQSKLRIQELLSFAEGTLEETELERLSVTLAHLQQIMVARIKDLGLSVPPGDHRGWFGNFGKAHKDSS